MKSIQTVGWVNNTVIVCIEIGRVKKQNCEL